MFALTTKLALEVTVVDLHLKLLNLCKVNGLLSWKVYFQRFHCRFRLCKILLEHSV